MDICRDKCQVLQIHGACQSDFRSAIRESDIRKLPYKLIYPNVASKKIRTALVLMSKMAFAKRKRS